MNYSKWLKTSLSDYFKRRRFKMLNFYVNEALMKTKDNIKILDVGCASGKDFLCYLNHR